MEHLIQDEFCNQLQVALTDEVLHYFHWPKTGLPRMLAEPVLRVPMRRFVRLAARFDAQAAETGFCAAAREILPALIAGCEVKGADLIPPTGPLIIAANHPGTYDALVVAAQLPRSDFKTIARGMPFLRLLPATRRALIFSTRDPHVKMAAARAAVQHLRAGGVLLLFPSGDLDPDPACMPDAAAALENWSESIALLLRKAPETRVMPAILSGFVQPRHFHHPIARLRREARQRQIAAEMIQVISQMVWGGRSDLTPQVNFGEPICPSALDPGQIKCLRDFIISQARKLLPV